MCSNNNCVVTVYTAELFGDFNKEIFKRTDGQVGGSSHYSK